MTGSLVPSDPISTSNEVMVTVSSSHPAPDLRHGLLGLLVTLGLGAAVGDALRGGVGGLELGLDGDGDLGHDREPLELLSSVHVFLFVVSEAATV